MKMVTCHGCGATKPHYARGLCITCYAKNPKRREYNRGWARRNRDRIRARQRGWNKENAVNRRIQQKRYRESHVELRREAVRGWNKKNPERKKRATRRWQKEHPEACKAHHAARDHRIAERRTETSRIIARWAKGWYSKARVTCYWCFKKIKPSQAHIDHIVPLSKGGEHSIENVCISCAACNQVKANKLPTEFEMNYVFCPTLFTIIGKSS